MLFLRNVWNCRLFMLNKVSQFQKYSVFFYLYMKIRLKEDIEILEVYEERNLGLGKDYYQVVDMVKICYMFMLLYFNEIYNYDRINKFY